MPYVKDLSYVDNYYEKLSNATVLIAPARFTKPSGEFDYNEEERHAYNEFAGLFVDRAKIIAKAFNAGAKPYVDRVIFKYNPMQGWYRWEFVFKNLDKKHPNVLATEFRFYYEGSLVYDEEKLKPKKIGVLWSGSTNLWGADMNVPQNLQKAYDQLVKEGYYFDVKDPGIYRGDELKNMLHFFINKYRHPIEEYIRNLIWRDIISKNLDILNISPSKLTRAIKTAAKAWMDEYIVLKDEEVEQVLSPYLMEPF